MPLHCVVLYNVRLHLLDGTLGNLQSQLLLGDGEVEPELAPGAEALVVREVSGHLGRGIAGSQGRLVASVGVHGESEGGMRIKERGEIRRREER